MVPASLPPYAHLSEADVQCVAKASATYQVPELLLHSIIRKENGRQGQAVPNKNGSRDLGLAQINTVWLGELKQYNITEHALKQDNCLNVQVASWVLRKYFLLKNDWYAATVAYNIGPNKWAESPNRLRIGMSYANSVIRDWHQLQNWVDTYNPSAPSASRVASTSLKNTKAGNS